MSTTKKILLSLLVIVLLIVGSGAVTYEVLNSRNQARPEAVAALQSGDEVTVSRDDGQDWYVFTPTGATPTTGLIIYPGGFVDPVAYAPIAQAIAAQGYLVVLDPMPLNLAVTAAESAGAIIAAHPEITAWAIGGHSLGGAMAAEYAADNPGAVGGLALWAAYPAANTDLSAQDIAVVSIYGDADGVAAVEDVLGAAERLPPDTLFVAIPGGNHTQFGAYGEELQQGDNPAGIDRAGQQAAIVAATVQMLQSISHD
jgi:pimeloyl-ACP methyl ester carboxylesterase